MADEPQADDSDRSERGYHKRFRVIREETGEEVEERTFTLIPSRDPLAAVALAAYAEAAREVDGNEDLHQDITEWLASLD